MKALYRPLPALALGLLVTISAQAQEARTRTPKVAVVAASGAAAARGLEELALAQLGGEKGLELLDRSAVERLLREQKLSVAGLVEANTAVRAGKILAVDLLATLSFSEATGENTGVVVFDAATGVRLADTGFAEADLAPQAQQVAAAVRTAVARWRAGPGGLKTVCLLPVRNADLPRAMDRFCEALAAALGRELLGSIAVLERARLDLFNQEKELAADAATRELLASLTTLEMDVSRGARGEGIRATVTLRDSTGKLLKRVAHEVADPNGTGLLAPLAGKVQEALKATSVNAQANRKREGWRFLREAQLLWKHKYYQQGLGAAEAAFALKPADDQRDLLAEYLLRYATELIHPGGMRTLVGGTWRCDVAPDTLREALVHARRGLQLLDAGGAERPDPAARGRKFIPLLVLDAQRFFFNKLPYVQIVPASAEARDEYEAFRLFCLRRIVAACYAAAEGPERDPKVLDRYTGAITNILSGARENLGWIAPSPAAYTQALHDLAVKWLDLSRRFKPEEIAPDTAAAFGGFLDRLYAPHMVPPSPGPAQAEAALEVFAAAARHPHPLVRLYGSHFQLRLLEKTGRLSRDEAIARHRALLAEGKRLIDGPPLRPPAKFRVATYRLLGHAIGSLYLHKKGAEVVREYFDLCDFMLAHGDVVEDVVRAAVSYGSPLRELNVKALAIIDRALQLTDSPARRYFADSPERFKLQMKEVRHKVLTQLPDVLKAAVPWESAPRVVQPSDLGATLLLPGLVHDGQYYFFAGGQDPATKLPLLQLARVPLGSGPVKVLSKALVSVNNPPSSSYQYAFWINPTYFVTSATVHDGRLYAGTTTEGILVFPLAGGDPKRVGEKEGLPARHVQKLAVVGGTLVVALEGGYLMAYDIASGRIETLASSRRGEKHSPFDDAGPFTLAQLAADPARQRVLFTLVLPRDDDPQAGLWELNVQTRRFRKVQPFVSGTWGPVIGGRIYLHHSDVFHDQPDVILAYELAEDRFTLLHGKAPAGYGDLKPAGLPADLSVAFPRVGLLHGGWYWQVYPFGRRRPGGKDEAFDPTPRDNTWTYAFAASVALQAAGPREVLVGDHGGLYVLHLKTD